MTYCGLAGTVQTNATGGCIVDGTLGSDDIAPAVVDIGLKVAIAVGTLATVIGLVLVWRFFTKKKSF